jgi:hypothetical protein
MPRPLPLQVITSDFPELLIDQRNEGGQSLRVASLPAHEQFADRVGMLLIHSYLQLKNGDVKIAFRTDQVNYEVTASSIPKTFLFLPIIFGLICHPFPQFSSEDRPPSPGFTQCHRTWRRYDYNANVCRKSADRVRAGGLFEFGNWPKGSRRARRDSKYWRRAAAAGNPNSTSAGDQSKPDHRCHD